MKSGTNPIIDLTDPLFIKWAEILDINYPPDGSVLAQKRASYDVRIAEYREASKPPEPPLRRLLRRWRW